MNVYCALPDKYADENGQCAGS